MAERTETATPRRIRQERERGRVPPTHTLSVTVGLAAGCGAALMARGRWLTDFRATMIHSIRSAPSSVMHDVTPDCARLAASALHIAVPCLAATFLGSALASGVQSGFVLSGRSAGRSGAVRMLAVRSYADSLAQLGRGVVVAAVGLASTIFSLRADFRTVRELTAEAARLAERSIGWMSVTALALAIVAVVLQRIRYLADLKMTREELMREQREEEGDPGAKAERSRRGRAPLEHHGTVRVVVTDESLRSVTLSWDELTDQAPVVVEKSDTLASSRVTTDAERFGIRIVDDPVLLAALGSVGIGDAIPEQLYDAVAAHIAARLVPRSAA